MEPKSFQNRFRSGFGRALDEDSVSKLKKERARSSGTAAAHPNRREFGPLGRGNKEGGSIVLTRLTTLSQGGSGGVSICGGRASNRCPHAQPFRNRFGTDFETILDPKMVQKSTKNRSKIDVCIRLRFLINFSIKNLFYIQAPN